MNCFQFVIWRSLTHRRRVSLILSSGCELLSICDLTIFDTPPYRSGQHLRRVVNCFQFVIWRSLTHPKTFYSVPTSGCELLSICDLTIFDTPHRVRGSETGSLWIAFNLWFDDLWHTYLSVLYNFGIVVNCFQFVIWRSLTHQASAPWILCLCCELLSICDLTIFDTPHLKRQGQSR